MEIKVRHTCSCVEVKIIEGGTTIDLGLLNDKERDELATTLMSAIIDMSPRYNSTLEWFNKLASENGITVA